KVLITGWDSLRDVAPLTELYDPATGTFGLTGEAGGPTRWWVNVNTTTLLRNGNVLIAGNEENDGFPAYAELYDPLTQIFFNLGNTTAPHEISTHTRAPEGQ